MKDKIRREVSEILSDAARLERKGNPACPLCGALMARSWANRHAWVCIEDKPGRTDPHDLCDGFACDCTDCGTPVVVLASRCAAGCERIVCDACYLRHCERGCTPLATYGELKV